MVIVGWWLWVLFSQEVFHTKLKNLSNHPMNNPWRRTHWHLLGRNCPKSLPLVQLISPKLEMKWCSAVSAQWSAQCGYTGILCLILEANQSNPAVCLCFMQTPQVLCHNYSLLSLLNCPSHSFSHFKMNLPFPEPSYLRCLAFLS